MLTLLATLLVAAPPTDTVPLRAASATPAPAIQITLNNDGSFAPGGRVNVQVQTNDDGYLLVFRVDGDGRIRVLFPLDPDGDAFVRGGKEYELRGRSDHETFLADNQCGNGLVYAAVSHTPYAYRDFVANGHWDYDALRLPDSSSDAETDLTAVVAQMTNHTRFDYDAVGYRVQEIGTVAAYGGGGYYPGYYDPYYDPRWRCLGCGWGYPGRHRYRPQLRLLAVLGSVPVFAVGIQLLQLLRVRIQSWLRRRILLPRRLPGRASIAEPPGRHSPASASVSARWCGERQ